MNNKLVDIYIYVKPQLNTQTISQITNKLVHTVGVKSAGINSNVKQLLTVKYNPESVSARELLSTAKSNGVQASLVGM